MKIHAKYQAHCNCNLHFLHRKFDIFVKVGLIFWSSSGHPWVEIEMSCPQGVLGRMKVSLKE